MAMKRKAHSRKRNVKRSKHSSSVSLPNRKRSMGGAVKTPLNSIFPKRITATLCYSTSIVLTKSSQGNSAFLTYRLNGIYDPFPAIGGHQPRGYDQLAAIYNKYVVHYADCVMTPYNSATSVPTKLFVMAHATQSPVIEFAGEEPGTVTRQMGGGISATPQVVKNRYYISKLSGKNVWSNEDVQSAVGSDPTEQYFVSFGARTSTSETIDKYPTMDINIYYRVTFFEQKDFTSS